MNKERFINYIDNLAARTIGVLPDSAHHAISKILNNIPFPELEPSIRTLLGLRRLRGADGIHPSPVQNRIEFRQQMLKLAIKSTPVHFVEDLYFQGAESMLKARRYVPEAIDPLKPLPLLVYIHGGSFSVGDLDTHDEPCRMLCKHGKLQIISVSYRLTPEHPFPAAYHDCIAAFKWACTQAKQWDVDLGLICIGGDSAGGSLSAAVSAALANTPQAPVAQLLIYPGIDFHLPTQSKDQYREGLTLSHIDLMHAYKQYNPSGNYAQDDPRLALLHADNLEKLPPTLIVTAGLDILRDEAEIYAKRISGLGVYTVLKRVIRQPHGFINMTGISTGARYATIQMAHDFKLMLTQIKSHTLGAVESA